MTRRSRARKQQTTQNRSELNKEKALKVLGLLTPPTEVAPKPLPVARQLFPSTRTPAERAADFMAQLAISPERVRYDNYHLIAAVKESHWPGESYSRMYAPKYALYLQEREKLRGEHNPFEAAFKTTLATKLNLDALDTDTSPSPSSSDRSSPN